MLAARVAAPLLAALAACGGRYPVPSDPGAASAALPALPYAIVDGRTGQAVDDAAFWGALGAADVVCVGEDHPDPHHHWAQREVVARLPLADGETLGLGMEMVQRPFQGVLDDYAAGRIDDAALQARTGWAERWGYDFGLYQPVLAAARARGAALLALNVPRELVRSVSRQGVAGLTPGERAQLPAELVLDDAEHRAWFDGVMRGLAEAHGDGAGAGHAHGHGHGHGGDGPSADGVYAAQVTWDEAMADGAAAWVRGGAGRAAVVIAGNGHCHESAVVRRVERRGPSAVSVRPIVDDGDGELAAAIAERRVDFLFVMTAPPAAPPER